MVHVCFNGQMIQGNTPVFKADNRGFRYGDGVFETIRVSKGRMPLFGFHFERLVTSLHLLKIQHYWTEELLAQWVIDLCQLNQCSDSARVRLAVYRNANGQGEIIIEAQSMPLTDEESKLQSIALTIYPFARKSMDAFANLKSANFLPYVMAGLYAVDEGFDDSIVLNCDNKICDSSKANIFIIQSNEIHTPALHQGCVSGVMRRYLIDKLKVLNYVVRQEVITEEDLLSADEIFLTNAIYGIKSVNSFKDRQYHNLITIGIFERLVTPLFT
jgi:branched-chain amino acid aminotransferase